MGHIEILFDADGQAISPSEISRKIHDFGDAYNEATKEIIGLSKILDNNGEVFMKCARRILLNFGMTRAGRFHGDFEEVLRGCWDAVGANLVEINNSIRTSGFPRARYIVEISANERKELFTSIWCITKKLLPFTMGKTSYGLVGASKILFSVLPEIVLPIDNTEWLHVFKTVDIGDVLHLMVFDIQRWEDSTGMQLNDLDRFMRLTTLPSVYNVMAMNARPKNF